MKITNCHGSEAKPQVVAKYNIKPIIYTKLLNGQEIDGCCGPITDKYYLFETEDKQTQDVGSFCVGSFCVGYDCAVKFLVLINHPKSSLFNPFQAELKNQNGENAGTGIGKAQQMDPLNKELSDAIQILCSAWGLLLNGAYGSHSNI